MENAAIAPQTVLPHAGPAPARKERLLSLDVFRGLTLMGMVLVNTPGSTSQRYEALAHVSWHGWAFADLVFPFFLFIVGVAIPYSVDGQLARGARRAPIVFKAFRRAVALFAIGLAMNWYAQIDFANWSTALDFAHLRYFNVLQRIGICSFLATLVYVWWKPRTQLLFGAAILVSYFVLMTFVPVPDFGAGILDKVGNWAQYIDHHVMGAHCGRSANGFYFEGKGLLTTLPALVTTLLGVAAGRCLRTSADALEKLVNLYFFGTLGLFLGAFWSLFFPINQNLWTSSLVLFMGGMAMVVLASCYYVADVRRIRWWTTPFIVFGMNSLAVWIGSVILRQTLDKIKLLSPEGKLVNLRAQMYNALAQWLDPPNASLAFALLYVLFWLAIMGILYRKRIFFKV